MPEITPIILAGGESKRIRSKLTKTLHPVCGRPMIEYPLQAASAVGAKKILVVVPNQKSHPLVSYLQSKKNVQLVAQKQPRGTGDAVQSCASALRGNGGRVLIMCGDTPLLRSETLKDFLKWSGSQNSKVSFITAKLDRPEGWGGRVVRDLSGRILKIVEEKELNEEEKGIKEFNTGVYSVEAKWLLEALKRLKAHPTGEYYLTDIIAEALLDSDGAAGFLAGDPFEFLGVNTRLQLGVVNEAMRNRLVRHWMERGVTFVDPRHVYLETDVTIGPDTVIYPQVHLRGQTHIGSDCVIEAGSILKDMKVGNGVEVKPYSVLESSELKKGAIIGPFARIRPDSVVGEGARVGNFVELKKAKLDAGVKVNHLTYLGDAHIGSGTNVGCGTITCNYDGKKKHPTKIGKKVFIGSDVQFIAPVTVGDGAYIAAGSTVTENVPPKALAIARSRQINKKGWANKK
ncbi:MAG: bifunctional UDP-N-acetylglucosamine diphosphorylase/glucosamine-1-phosphate N-acetyltransferase GlmU [Deltaproteobacteria bacterium]|nr:bifunctional UDP-N-acetylglucosamine diphosphorylase/glucosamine-1-phosphate N-acetyltransferase GlmU [Deltaproteobacteria bacterium]